jgi:hypothetical protein
LKIPFKEVRLINRADVAVTPTHDDHILNEPILITRSPVSEIISFPNSIIQGDACTWIMDKKWNTTITLDVSSITLNQIPLETQSWSIPYVSLVAQNVQSKVPYFVATPSFDATQVVPITTPPKLIWFSGSGAQSMDEQTYWQKMGLYIWNRIMQENFP